MRLAAMAGCVITTLVISSALPVLAQETPLTVEDRLRELERLVRDQQRTIADQGATIQQLRERQGETDPARIDAAVDKYLEEKKKKGELTDWKAGYDGKFFMGSTDDNFRLQIGGYGQADSRWFPTSYPPTDTFFLRDMRPSIDGKLWKYYEFKIQFELNTSTNNIRDAWLNFHYIDELQFKVGQHKHPFCRDDLRGADATDFIDAPYITRFISPSRDSGASFHGKLFDGIVEYGVGFYNGDGINVAPDTNDAKDVAARINLSPFKTFDNFWLKGLEIGASYSGGEQDKTIGGRTFTTSAGTVFYTLTPATLRENSKLFRYNADFGWRIGPASLQGEWGRMEIEDATRPRVSAAVPRLVQDFEIDTFYIQATYLLTGDDKTWKHVKPKQNFDPKEGGWGAWELAGRYQYLDFNANMTENGLATGTEKLWSLTGGVNWYLNPHVEIMLDYEYTRYDDQVVRVGRGLEEEEHMASLRFKFLF
ncbi:MAG: hypothetical protein HY720_11665 [Planctomycetes bacterium]|nr:hypothetical protein [Planctomycetota bacterium]